MSTPDVPELARYEGDADQRRGGNQGKHGVLAMQFARSDSRSVLAHLQRQAPLLAQQALYWDERLPEMPCVFVITTSGCVVQGDRLDISISVGPGAMAHVTTPAATKVHEMDAGFAVQSTHLDVAEGSYTELLPGPVIPHRHSRFAATTTATVAATATVLIAEQLAPGRKYHGDGEVFEYDLYSSGLTIARPDGTGL
jgi:urease accessory protein